MKIDSSWKNWSPAPLTCTLLLFISAIVIVPGGQHSASNWIRSTDTLVLLTLLVSGAALCGFIPRCLSPISVTALLWLVLAPVGTAMCVIGVRTTDKDSTILGLVAAASTILVAIGGRLSIQKLNKPSRVWRVPWGSQEALVLFFFAATLLFMTLFSLISLGTAQLLPLDIYERRTGPFPLFDDFGLGSYVLQWSFAPVCLLVLAVGAFTRRRSLTILGGLLVLLLFLLSGEKAVIYLGTAVAIAPLVGVKLGTLPRLLYAFTTGALVTGAVSVLTSSNLLWSLTWGRLFVSPVLNTQAFLDYYANQTRWLPNLSFVGRSVRERSFALEVGDFLAPGSDMSVNVPFWVYGIPLAGYLGVFLAVMLAAISVVVVDLFFSNDVIFGLVGSIILLGLISSAAWTLWISGGLALLVAIFLMASWPKAASGVGVDAVDFRPRRE